MPISLPLLTRVVVTVQHGIPKSPGVMPLAQNSQRLPLDPDLLSSRLCSQTAFPGAQALLTLLQRSQPNVLFRTSCPSPLFIFQITAGCFLVANFLFSFCRRIADSCKLMNPSASRSFPKVKTGRGQDTRA